MGTSWKDKKKTNSRTRGVPAKRKRLNFSWETTIFSLRGSFVFDFLILQLTDLWYKIQRKKCKCKHLLLCFYVVLINTRPESLTNHSAVQTWFLWQVLKTEGTVQRFWNVVVLSIIEFKDSYSTLIYPLSNNGQEA